MALVRHGMTHTETRFGERLSPVYYDTDDLDNLSYHYYTKAQSLKIYGLANRLLRGEITGSEIENNPGKYKDIIG